MFNEDKRAAGMGPNAHEGNDFMPTRESKESPIPGGYSDDHWEDEHARVMAEKAKREEEERLKGEMEAAER